MTTNARWNYAVLCAAVWLGSACSNGQVASERDARNAYLGLDRAVERSLVLGMQGFNMAQSANIPTQMEAGQVSGTITVTGQVDQGASANKEMRLQVALMDYRNMLAEDSVMVTYTNTTPAALNLSLRGIPNATMTGTLTGTFTMSGELSGDVTLNLMISGRTEPDPANMMMIRRVAGSTTVTGTAVSRYGTYNVNITL